MPHPARPEKPTEILPEHTFKGCIHWYGFATDKMAKTIDDIHPCIIIGRNNEKSKRIIISPISDADNYLKSKDVLKYEYHVLLKKDKYKFLDKDSVILLDQVFTIPKELLFEEWYIDKIDETRQIDEAIMQNYDLIQTVTELLHEMVDKLAEEKTG